MKLETKFGDLLLVVSFNVGERPNISVGFLNFVTDTFNMQRLIVKIPIFM